MVRAIKQDADVFELKKIFEFPIDQAGQDILNLLPAALAGRSEINTIPGTKGQGAALALWGRRHGAAVWAFTPDESQRLVRLGAPGEKPKSAVPLKTWLKVMVFPSPIQDYGWGKADIDWNEPFYDRMLEFMRQRGQNELRSPRFLTAVKLPGFKLSLNDQEVRLAWAAWPGGPAGHFIFDLKDGKWFEKLTAKAVAAIKYGNGVPAYEVAVGVKIGWLPPVTMTMTELDVLAAGNQNNYLISCKAKYLKNEDLEKLTPEVKATAASLGRFTRPVICHLGSADQPRIINGVLIIGWPTLCLPEALRAALETSAKK
jgi:hypothetical protein